MITKVCGKVVQYYVALRPFSNWKSQLVAPPCQPQLRNHRFGSLRHKPRQTRIERENGCRSRTRLVRRMDDSELLRQWQF